MTMISYQNKTCMA